MIVEKTPCRENKPFICPLCNETIIGKEDMDKFLDEIDDTTLNQITEETLQDWKNEPFLMALAPFRCCHCKQKFVFLITYTRKSVLWDNSWCLSSSFHTFRDISELEEKLRKWKISEEKIQFQISGLKEAFSQEWNFMEVRQND
jgi:hypothetical protein